MAMSLRSEPVVKNRAKLYFSLTAALMLVLLMVFDTKVVNISEQEEVLGFSAERFGEENFPDVKEYVEDKAVDVEELASEVFRDSTAAGERYGVSAGIGFVVPVRLSGTVLEGKSGIHELDVAGVPDDLTIRVQTGPAINGTSLRDATGTIQFGDFTNQIEYQDAGAALNNEMKEQVIEGIDRDGLVGQSVEVVGVFTLINPKNWLLTPVGFEIIE